MEVPERIWLYSENGGPLDNDWCFEAPNAEEIEAFEYVLVDVFIEKACERLDSVFKKNMGYYAGSQAVEDFRNYMKGE